MKLKVLFITLFLFADVFCQMEAQKFYTASAYEQAGEFERAKTIYEELYNKDRNNYQYFDALVRINNQLKLYDTSILIIEDKLKSNPNDINVYALLGKTYHMKGDENKAEEVWLKAGEITNNEFNYRILANAALERRAFSTAIKLLKKGKDIAQEPVAFSFELAQLFTLTMQYKDAALEYVEVLTKAPNQLPTIQNRILQYINKPEALSQSIDVIKKHLDVNEAFPQLLAWLYRENKQYDEAFNLYKDIDDNKNSNGQLLLDFGRTVFDRGEYDLSLKVFKDLIEEHPNSEFIPSAKFYYARAIEAINNKKDKNSWKPLEIISNNNDKSDDEVIKIYKELSELFPNNDVASESNLRIGRIYLYKNNDLQKAEEYFQKVTEGRNQNFKAEALMELGKVELLKGNIDKSEQFLQNVVQNKGFGQENNNSAALRLAKLYFYEQDFNKSKETLNGIIDNLKDNSANDALELSLILNTGLNDSLLLVKFSQAEFSAAKQDFQNADKLYKEIGESKSIFLESISKIREAEILLALDSLDLCLILLNDISNLDSKNIYADKALLLMGKIYQFGKLDNDNAVKMYNDLLARFPNSMYLDEARENILEIKTETNKKIN
ncbi:MAG TPA: tetratricopeptide repeat protein [Ignavibacteriaceae bacterium]|nr:tetratricopeptide repeat protein [Ignavibacteriaceae bacterium]